MAAITAPPFTMTDIITDRAITTGPVTITAVMMETGMTTAAAMIGVTIQVAVTIGGAGNKPAQTVLIHRVPQGHREMTADPRASPIYTFLQ
jgi:hypothetical protein